MEFGQPSTGAPAAAIDAARRALDSDRMGYWESAALQERLARLYRERYGIETGAGQFLLTCGASPALLMALSIGFEAGDRIAMARPGYVPYRNPVRALGMLPVEIPSGAETRFQLTADALATIEPAPPGIIIASPANPTGPIIETADPETLRAGVADRGVLIINEAH